MIYEADAHTQTLTLTKNQHPFLIHSFIHLFNPFTAALFLYTFPQTPAALATIATKSAKEIYDGAIILYLTSGLDE
jgi:hypothetical protein